MNKYSRENVDEILELYKSGEKVTVIAAKFNTSSGYISYIANKHGLTRQTRKASGGGEGLSQVPQEDRSQGRKILSLLRIGYSLKPRDSHRQAYAVEKNCFSCTCKLSGRV